MLTSIRAPLGLRRFLSNVCTPYEFTKYRIDRVPMYELIRCGLEIPPPSVPEYTGIACNGSLTRAICQPVASSALVTRRLVGAITSRQPPDLCGDEP